MIEPKCPFCGGECTIQMSYSDGWEFVRNFECDKCHGLFREVYAMEAMKFVRPQILRKSLRRADNE